MKRKLEIVLLALTVFVLSQSASATIRRVGLNQSYLTLTAAYNAASNDDTLLISPGVYNETITSTKRLTWLGAGYDLVATNGALILNSGSSGTSVLGWKIQASRNSGGAIELGAGVDQISIERCWLYNSINQNGLYAACIKRASTPGGNLIVHSCILEPVNNSTGGCVCFYSDGDTAILKNCILHRRSTSVSAVDGFRGTPQLLEIENCVFLNLTPFNMANGNITCRNTIQYDGSFGWGSYPPGTVFDFNASQVSPPGTNGLLLSTNPFQNYSTSSHFQYGVSDLHLVAGSPCIDAGDPAILDLDNSRSDMGIYGGQTPHVDGGAPNYPFAIDLTIPANISSGQQLPIQATGRIGAGY